LNISKKRSSRGIKLRLGDMENLLSGEHRADQQAPAPARSVSGGLMILNQGL
jgi:hypothetical protein